MNRARIACVMATQGRSTLSRAINSVISQETRSSDILLLVVDRREPLDDDAEAVLATVLRAAPYYFDINLRVMDHPNNRPTFSHEQAAYGLSFVPDGHWISLIGDDDVYTPGAWKSIRDRAEAGPPRPLLFRMDHNAGGIIWREVGRIQEGQISEQNLIVPKLPGLIGTWDFERYSGDFEWVDSTLKLWAARGIEPDWDDTIIQFSRPADRGYRDDLD